MRKMTLSDEDQGRVDSYLSGPNHQVDRQPFRPWLLLGVTVVVLTVLSLLSYAIAWWHGVV
jgi:hypothetical protein